MDKLNDMFKEVFKMPIVPGVTIMDEIKDMVQTMYERTYELWKADKFNINYLFFGEVTLLHFAAEYGHVELADLLIRNGADVNAVDINKETPLHYADRYGNIRIIEKLIDCGADVTARGKFELPLHIAIKRASHGSRERLVNILIENGANIHAANELGETALHAVAKLSKCLTIAKRLIAKGANVDAFDKNQNVPLHCAAARSNLDMVKLLVKNSASIDSSNDRGETPLHLAVKMKQLNMVKYLVDCGAPIDAETIDHKTPIDYARDKRFTDILEYLRQNAYSI